MDNPSSLTDPAQWVDLHGDVLYSYAISRLRDSEIAEELVQETFLAALKYRDQFSGKGAQGAWMMGILKRKVIDLHRARTRNPVNFDTGDETLATLFDQDGNWAKSTGSRNSHSMDTIESEEFREVFTMCLGHLSHLQSSAFLLKEVQETSAQEICQQLGITSSNLWVLLHRARLRLAECIRSHWPMGDADNA